MSICLYDYLCQQIVGSEDYVRLIRLINASTDRISSQKGSTEITSGSFGEGFELQGSDLDIMYVIPNTYITEQMKRHTCHSDDSFILLYTDDVKPGFAYLRLMNSNENEQNMCLNLAGQSFLSSVLFKQYYLNESLPNFHGPCISDNEGMLDFAFCLHSKSWISNDSEWITRSNNEWPTSEVKQRIIRHGVLFVPIGTGANVHDEFKWRISFSVGEKFLIYSFTHTQLLCYALMKILLRDVISKSPECYDLLCSYFVKTIIFWISEELPTSVWKPENIIHCFMKCLKRLVYCVEYSLCPHYFIPENNLFENKIVGQGRTQLLETLYIMNNYGWQCIFFSEQISIVSLFTRVQFNKDTFVHDIRKIIKSKALLALEPNLNAIDYVRYLKLIFSSKTKKLRHILLYNMTRLSLYVAHTMQLSSSYGNNYKYKQCKQCLCYILQGTHHDAVTGWLMLASLFYKKKQYKNALYILSYSLRKCTTQKLYEHVNASDLQRDLFNFQTFRKLGTICSLRMLFMSTVRFFPKSTLIPDGLEMGVHNFFSFLPPVIYLHFLTFLCHYHLNNIRNYQESLGDLRLTMEEHYLISDKSAKAAAYECLGVAFQIIGDKESAREAFIKSIILYPDKIVNNTFKRLSRMD